MATRYIYTKEDLQNIGAGDANGANWRVAGYDASWVMSDDYVIMNDIDLDGMNFKPIGNTGTTNAGVRFLGTLEGNNYKIYNGEITGSYYVCGLFNYLGDATTSGADTGGYISNLQIEIEVTNAYDTSAYGFTGILAGIMNHYDGEFGCTNVHCKGNVTTAGARAGGIVGTAYGGGASFCSYSGNVTQAKRVMSSSAGSIIGWIYSYGLDVEIINCWGSGIIKAYADAGGISGYVFYRNGYPSTVQINNCSFVGTVKVWNDVALGHVVRAGGIAGYINPLTYDFKCSNCMAITSLEVKDTDYKFVGGIWGAAVETGNLEMTNCYAVATYTVEGAGTNYLSGLSEAVEVEVATNNYYDTDVSGLDTGETAGLAKTTLEMKNIALYEGDWDIKSIYEHDGKEATSLWYIDNEDDYPRLWFAWESISPEVRIKIAGTFLQTSNLYLKSAGHGSSLKNYLKRWTGHGEEYSGVSVLTSALFADIHGDVSLGKEMNQNDYKAVVELRYDFSISKFVLSPYFIYTNYFINRGNINYNSPYLDIYEAGCKLQYEKFYIKYNHACIHEVISVGGRQMLVYERGLIDGAVVDYVTVGINW